jgi:hypothetical protein
VETPTPAPQPKKPVRSKPKKPATPTTPPATPAPAQESTAANPGSGVSAIGQLSAGASGEMAAQTDEMINSTEKGVNAITRSLSEPETKTVAHIREFLKQAREALTSGDVDGAHTLAMKARVLLAELNQ